MPADPSQREIEEVARAIAKSNGDNFDNIATDKAHWTSRQGFFGGRFRDINEPMQPDYLDMAESAIRALDLLREGKD